MSESQQERVAQLLQEGLDHYGEGRSREAAACWGEVLFLQPGHPEARDYLDALGSDGGPEAAAPAAARTGGLAEDALRLMHEGHLEAALELFETLGRRDSQRLDVQGYLEMLRSKLLSRYRDRVGGMEVVPHVRMSRQELMKFNLPATTGFLLSLVDGRTSVHELISLSGLDPFDTLRMLSRLLDAGVVRCDA